MLDKSYIRSNTMPHGGVTAYSTGQEDCFVTGWVKVWAELVTSTTAVGVYSITCNTAHLGRSYKATVRSHMNLRAK